MSYSSVSQCRFRRPSNFLVKLYPSRGHHRNVLQKLLKLFDAIFETTKHLVAGQCPRKVNLTRNVKNILEKNPKRGIKLWFELCLQYDEEWNIESSNDSHPISSGTFENEEEGQEINGLNNLHASYQPTNIDEFDFWMEIANLREMLLEIFRNWRRFLTILLFLILRSTSNVLNQKYGKAQCLNTGEQTTAVERNRARAYCRYMETKLNSSRSNNEYKLETDRQVAIGSMAIKIPSKQHRFHLTRLCCQHICTVLTRSWLLSFLTSAVTVSWE